MPTKNPRDEFKSKAISAWEAYRCCVGGRNTAVRYLSSLAGGVVFSEQVDDGTCALMPGPGVEVVEVCVKTPQGGPSDGRLILVRILTGVGVALAAELLLTNRERPEVARALQNAANAIREGTRDVCYDCVRSKLWRQDSDRKHYYGARASDGTFERDLYLRLPRR